MDEGKGRRGKKAVGGGKSLDANLTEGYTEKRR